MKLKKMKLKKIILLVFTLSWFVNMMGQSKEFKRHEFFISYNHIIKNNYESTSHFGPSYDEYNEGDTVYYSYQDYVKYTPTIKGKSGFSIGYSKRGILSKDIFLKYGFNLDYFSFDYSAKTELLEKRTLNKYKVLREYQSGTTEVTEINPFNTPNSVFYINNDFYKQSSNYKVLSVELPFGLEYSFNERWFIGAFVGLKIPIYTRVDAIRIDVASHTGIPVQIDANVIARAITCASFHVKHNISDKYFVETYCGLMNRITQRGLSTPNKYGYDYLAINTGVKVGYNF